jgi:hypothetical protein
MALVADWITRVSIVAAVLIPSTSHGYARRAATGNRPTRALAASEPPRAPPLPACHDAPRARTSPDCFIDVISEPGSERFGAAGHARSAASLR